MTRPRWSPPAVRTLLQGIGFAVLVAIVMVLYPAFTSAHRWAAHFHWSLIGFAVFQAADTAVLAWFTRTFLDPSTILTPLPPAKAREPSDPTP